MELCFYDNKIMLVKNSIKNNCYFSLPPKRRQLMKQKSINIKNIKTKRRKINNT